MAFLRIKLLEAILDHTKPVDPVCSVNIKEAVAGPTGAVTLEQRKKTFHPDWDRCFDSHLKPGRRVQIIVNERADGVLRPLAEVTVEAEALANECMQEEAASAVKLGVSVCRTLSGRSRYGLERSSPGLAAGSLTLHYTGTACCDICHNQLVVIRSFI